MVWLKFVIKAFLLPPGSIFLLILLSCILSFSKRPRRKILGWGLFLLSFFSLYYFCTPQGAASLMRPLQDRYLPFSLEEYSADAIVVFGSGQRKQALEYMKQNALDASSLIRLSYAAYLYRKTGLPILLSGGPVLEDDEPLAKVMERSLKDVFSISPKWIEEKSENTAENALFSSKILKESGVKTILLVTEAWHMRRAVLSFRSTGLKIIAAPTNYEQVPFENKFLAWLPSADALLVSRRAIHEWLGYIWYSLTVP